MWLLKEAVTSGTELNIQPCSTLFPANALHQKFTSWSVARQWSMNLNEVVSWCVHIKHLYWFYVFLLFPLCHRLHYSLNLKCGSQYFKSEILLSSVFLPILSASQTNLESALVCSILPPPLVFAHLKWRFNNCIGETPPHPIMGNVLITVLVVFIHTIHLKHAHTLQHTGNCSLLLTGL